VTITWTASDNVSVSLVDVELSRSGSNGPFEMIADDIANTGSYAWTPTGPLTADAWIRVTAFDGAANPGSDLCDAAFVITDVVSDIAQTSLSAFDLRPLTPNPLRGFGTLSFAIPRATHVQIRVIDVRGRVVGTLLDERRPLGLYSLSWDGTVAGRRLASGAYFIELQAGGQRIVQRALIVR
jgi:hypothetical protein